MSYVVILEGPETRLVTEYASRAEAVPAVEQEVDRLQAAGATIEAICPAAISLGGRNRRPRKTAVLADGLLGMRPSAGAIGRHQRRHVERHAPDLPACSCL